MQMLFSIPAFPVTDIVTSTNFYKKIGFTIEYLDQSFTVLSSGKVQIHLWSADEYKNDGLSSCQIEINGLETLHAKLIKLGLLEQDSILDHHSKGFLKFNLIDPDNNLITFIEQL